MDFKNIKIGKEIELCYDVNNIDDDIIESLEDNNIEKIIITDVDYNSQLVWCNNITGAISFDNFILIDDVRKNELKNDVKITKDNIHLYYEFMSDEDLEKYKDIIADILDQRILKVAREIKKSDSIASYAKFIGIAGLNSEPKHIQQLDIVFGNWILKFELFGVKDTLKPIDEYIEEIKSSKDCKEYMASRS